MKKEDNVAEDRLYLSYGKKLLYKHGSLFWLLVSLTAIIPGTIALKSNKVFAQVESSPVISLNKQIIYVNPKSGDDQNEGAKSSPLQTITQALKIAESGTTIQLAPGEYNQDNGEKFPLIIKNQIILQGNPQNQGHQIIINGGGDFVSPTGAGQNVTIAALQDAAGVKGVTITNNHSRGHGLWIESSNPTVTSNTFTRNGNTGLSVNGKSKPLIEDNYFYNNSGNGLLVYGTSQPEIIENTFEQTGFGVSLVQNAHVTLQENYFDGNRIGIILEGDSQATLRDNEIINSEESGLTAIANSLVDLGNSEEPGNNVFRSNRKLDIQNASSNEIIAVGTEIHGDLVGKINFDRGNFIARTNTNTSIPPLLPPLNSNSSTSPNSSTSSNLSLPSPPPLPEAKNSTKEFIFTPGSAVVSPAPEPVPYVPQINNSALGANNSQISSLADVLGSGGGVAVKYKILVEAENEFDITKVRSLYPDAFNTIYQGKSVLQIGAFNNWDKAKQAIVSLENLGLEVHILE